MFIPRTLAVYAYGTPNQPHRLVKPTHLNHDSRSPSARLCLLANGILHLASCAPVHIITTNSHLGSMPCINTLKSMFKGLSDQKAVAIRKRAHDTDVYEKSGRLITKTLLPLFDSVQHFLHQREMRIGRENTMIIGVAATSIELEVDAAALDILDKQP
ncbi:hypothetical protein FIBSPDRAFT_1042497 [Athelia psychrophila]|uniref:Uncharacterized protein n=1 Tax=Athelia psychrophila TaxID=1759441 RepID=A0A166MF63_9AGAM|nr:hypothetical protein FIBSPDRAFT_1042497 [Fibularhizoctonia sp. CBS 109695]